MASRSSSNIGVEFGLIIDWRCWGGVSVEYLWNVGSWGWVRYVWLGILALNGRNATVGLGAKAWKNYWDAI